MIPDPNIKARELVDLFKSKELAYNCTEEIIGALYDVNIRQPEYWYKVQEEINLLS